MANFLREKNGTSTSTAQLAEAVGHDLQIRTGATGAGKGGDVYLKEGVAANGDITYRWHRFEAPAK